MKNRNFALIAILIVGALTLTGCAAGDPMFTEQQPAGFWMGVWHGMIAWITFIIGLFDPSVEVYERFNNGGWYDFGFLFGVGGSCGSASSSASRRRRSSSSRRRDEED